MVKKTLYTLTVRMKLFCENVRRILFGGKKTNDRVYGCESEMLRSSSVSHATPNTGQTVVYGYEYIVEHAADNRARAADDAGTSESDVVTNTSPRRLFGLNGSRQP